MRFKFNPRIMEHLGSELITSDEVAITELVKNAYDAGSEEVRIHFFTSISEAIKGNMLTNIDPNIISLFPPNILDSELIVIEDIGDGMSHDELEECFFTVGTDIKKQIKQDDSLIRNKKRVPIGEKGIGRLAAQRLGKILVVETASKQTDKTSVAMINWEDFQNTQLNPEEIDIKESNYVKQRDSFTRLWILGSDVYQGVILHDKFVGQMAFFDDSDGHMTISEELKSSISFLMSPFNETKEDFTISIFRNSIEIIVDFKHNLLNAAESEHSFELEVHEEELVLRLRMDIRPWYLERVHSTLIPPDTFSKYRRDHKFYGELLEKHKQRFEKTFRMSLVEEDISKFYKASIEKTITKGLKKETLKNKKEEIEEAIKNAISERITYLKLLCPISSKVYSFNRDHKTSTIDLESAKEYEKIECDTDLSDLRDFLDTKNGIKLYRGNCRIGSLGDKDNDWIRLQQHTTSGPQFYRFDLGNTVGFVKINDPFQRYVKEISSRLDLSENKSSIALKELVRTIFGYFFYNFSVSAKFICKDIIKEESLLPQDTIVQLSERISDANQIATESKKNINELNKNFQIMMENAELDSEEKVNAFKGAFSKLVETTKALNVNVDRTINHVVKSSDLLEQVKHEKKQIEIETFNNYKLMANGIITETITHELDSIINNSEDKQVDINEHFLKIRRCLLDTRSVQVLNNDYKPVYDRYFSLNTRMQELGHFYTFLEKTFVYKGTYEDFMLEDLSNLLKLMNERLSKRLCKYNITLEFDSVKSSWQVPKGVMLHVLYNLIDNSIFWIEHRRNTSKYDKSFIRQEKDVIKVIEKDKDVLLVCDSGTGVLDNFQYNLFDPLITGKGKEGRGMGLYIVRRLLMSFGANIELLVDKNEYGNRYIFAIYRDYKSNRQDEFGGGQIDADSTR